MSGPIIQRTIWYVIDIATGQRIPEGTFEGINATPSQDARDRADDYNRRTRRAVALCVVKETWD